MRRFRTLWHIIKKTGFLTFTSSFVSFLVLTGFLLKALEPGIQTVWDGLWFAFVTSTTVGYGDYQAVTFFGRIVSVLLTIYGLVFFAALSGVVINYYTDLHKQVEK